MKKILYALVIIALLSSPCANAASLFSGSGGQKILFVMIADDENPVSDMVLIKNAFDKGGRVVLDVAVAREFDSQFDEKYAAVDSNDQFLINPAILNFVGGQGWNFVQMQLGPQFIFVKDR